MIIVYSDEREGREFAILFVHHISKDSFSSISITTNQFTEKVGRLTWGKRKLQISGPKSRFQFPEPLPGSTNYRS